MRSFPVSQALIGLFGLAVFITSFCLYRGAGRYGAGFMPCLLGALLFIFALIDATIARRNPGRHQSRLCAAEVRAVCAIIVPGILFVLLVDTLGFIVSATCLVFFLTLWRRPKKVFSSLIFATIIACVINYIFVALLLVALPQGVWR